MTIKDCIDIVDNIKPNQYTIKDKVGWLSFIEGIIINEVLKTHEGYDGRYDDFEGYTEDKLSVPLAVPSPYDRLYTEYLKMMIDKENGEVARYNNSMISYNTYMTEYRKHYNKTHMPLDMTKRRMPMPPKKVSTGLSDAEYENLKRDMTYILTEHFSDAVSDDKISAVVKNFVTTNIAMLKGKDGLNGINGKDGYTPRKGIDYFDGKKGDKGDTPIKGVDYYTDEDKEEIRSYMDEQTQIIEADVEGIKAQINKEAHFRGYVTTNAKIKDLKATPNDFAYSAESGTKWIYDSANGWQDTNIPVPDQLTPASNAQPLINGEASPGEAEEYARGDHRHPTDTTRESVANKVTAINENSTDEQYPSAKAVEDRFIYAFNIMNSTFENYAPKEEVGNIETALDNIIAQQNSIIEIQNSLIGGGSQ